MPEKIIRDPVHDVIAFQLDKPADALCFSLIAAREFQRLRRIRQLGMASLAYPGADHSRYSHSLGVMQTARRMLERLCRNFYIPAEDQLVCVCAALLHDLGHGPFSHVFERVSGIHHETVTSSIILSPDSDIHRILAAHDRSLPARIVSILQGEAPRTFLHDIISSQLDADRLDYLLRDNYMTGSQYGDFDLTWLLHAMVIDESTKRLSVTWKGISAIEDYLQARYHMYRNVYFHKVVRAGEGMLKLALQRAKRLAIQHRLTWPLEEEPVHKALLGRKLTTAEFRELDDVSMMHCFKLWSRCDDPVLASLCSGLLDRNLFKTVPLHQVETREEAQLIADTAAREIDRQGGESAYEMFYDEAADTPYETYEPGSPEDGYEISVIEPDGVSRPFGSISPLVQALNRQLMFRRIHVSAKYRDTVVDLVRRIAH